MNKIKVILEAGKDGFGVSFPDIENIFGFGETIELAQMDAQKVLNFYITSIIKSGRQIPEFLQGEFELKFEFDVEALLKYIDGTVTKTALAKASGINVSQLSHYSSGLKKPRQLQREKLILGLHKIGKDLLALT